MGLRGLPDLREKDHVKASAMLAVHVYGNEMLRNYHMVWTAGLALAQDRLTVHQLDNATVVQVNETEVRSLPPAPPRFMASGFCIETGDLNTPLFADVVCLGGYRIGDTYSFILYQRNERCSLGYWSPRWGEGEIEEGYVEEDLPFLYVDVNEQFRSLIIQAARFVITLGLLLEAENTPMQQREEREVAGFPRKHPMPKNRNPYVWSIRKLNLKPSPVPADPAGDAPEEPLSEPPRMGLSKEKRLIRGFLRRQVYGPGRALRKWVYVSAFEGTRWVSERPLRVNVSNG